ncbi:MAG TPA: flippase [Acidimicrobiales bacterium]|nr:flippase [Acidimicrobiales bacterium]
MTDVGGSLDGRVGRPVARNVAALSVAQLVNLLLHVAWFAVLTAHLGASRLGVYVFAVAVPDLLGPIVDFGFTAIAARDIAQHPQREAKLLPNLFYLRLLISLVCFGAVVVILHAAGYNPPDVHAATVAALITLLTTLQSLQVVLEVRLRMGWVAIGNLTESLILVAGVAVLSHAGAGVMPFVWLYVGANGINLGIAATRALQLGRLDWAPDPAVLRPLLRAALPLGAAGLVTGLYYRLDVFVLAWVQTSNAVGQFGAGYRFIDSVGAFPGLMVAVLNPVFARSVRAGREVLRRRYAAVMHLATVPTVVIGVGGSMTAWRALPAVHAFRHYHGGGVVLAVLCPAAGLILLGSVASAVMYAADQQRLLLRIAVAVLAVSAVLDFTLIPAFSYVGAAAATTAGEAVSVVALAVAIRRRLGVGWPLDRLAQSLRAGAALGAVLAVGYLLPPLVQLGLGVVAAPVALVLTGALRPSDLAWLRREATATNTATAASTPSPERSPAPSATQPTTVGPTTKPR